MYHNASDSESTRQQHTKVLSLSLVMLILATLYTAVVWIRVQYGFVDLTGESNDIFYSHPSLIVKLACLCNLSLIRDGILIWWMYNLYNKRLVVVAPAALFVFAYTAVACIVLGLVENLRAEADVKVLEACIFAFFLLTTVTNVLCSGAIALKIFVTRSTIRNMTAIWLTALVIAESSTLYTLSVVAALTTFLTRSSSDGQYPAMDAIVLLVSAVIIPQICFHIISLTDSLRDSQLLNAAWLGQKGYPVIDEDFEYPLLQTHTTVSVSKYTNVSLHEPISEKDEPTPLLFL